MNRRAVLDRFQSDPHVSVLVVGAGVNGIGTFRDLALQGVDVLLVDRGDFCSGASAASSHMVHGGIRYLENGEFRLVREAVRERNRLIQNAPHLVKPLPTIFPIFRFFSGLLNAPFKFLGLLDKPAERGAVVIKIGMSFYDAYTRAQGTVPKHTFFSKRDALKEFPRLSSKIIYAGKYYDAAMPSPERICIELIRDGIQASENAMALNYVSLVGANGAQVTLQDEITGEFYQVVPKVVVNAGGPWIDFVNHKIGRESTFIGGTKGSHLVLDHPELRAAIGEHEFFFENKDGRIVLIFPLADKVMIGTSDIRIHDPDEARCTEEEIDYFFDMVTRVFPGLELKLSQIVFRFSGVRPLPAQKVGFTGQISRDHSVEVIPAGEGLPFPIYSLVGGKWTSFRAFSEQVTDKVLAYIGQERRASTRELPIGGGKGYPLDPGAWKEYVGQYAERYPLAEARILELLKRYGTGVEAILDFICMEADDDVNGLPGYSQRELAYLVQNEGVVHLDDLILRRTMIGKLGMLTGKSLSDLAELTAQVKGWSGQQTDREVNRTKEIFWDRHGVQL